MTEHRARRAAGLVTRFFCSPAASARHGDARRDHVQPDDGRKAEEEMRRLGAEPIQLQQLAA